jgi:hypothetical protein
MTMNFRTLKSNIQDILADAAAGRFRVIGHSSQARSAIEVIGVKRSVQVYFYLGEMDRGQNASSIGTVQHDVTIKIELTVGAATKVDLSILSVDGVTPAQIASAIDAFQEGSAIADDNMDELFDIVWNVVMESAADDFGMTKGDISNIWIGSLSKDDPLPRGEYAVLTGSMNITARVTESATGNEVQEADDINVTVDLYGDDVEETEVAVQF